MNITKNMHPLIITIELAIIAFALLSVAITLYEEWRDLTCPHCLKLYPASTMGRDGFGRMICKVEQLRQKLHGDHSTESHD